MNASSTSRVPRPGSYEVGVAQFTFGALPNEETTRRSPGSVPTEEFRSASWMRADTCCTHGHSSWCMMCSAMAKSLGQPRRIRRPSWWHFPSSFFQQRRSRSWRRERLQLLVSRQMECKSSGDLYVDETT
ncbi:hypothetical protein H310_03852 [Aphanomyces invadans]|uniref:Uncharacterized protein n=1 Tax=Aphanomyces invadans TaxID=157072 RepID=A0A024UGB8_9STRA|nr:hypothetical protein H310_03852 [Aphanomyces invadans]ETW04693.1 hypothetical protein H310_03852 [Aphanomyces invadans]|eukprot:XP_008866131.1 hypothetical protein H310_03852 [Aphanomyces invadans]